MTVDAPRRENAFGETVFAGTSDVIHDFMPAVLDDGVANAFGEGVEGFIPRGAFPFSFAAFAGAFERVEDAIGIGYLVESRWSFGAIPSSRTRMLRIPLKLLHLAGDLVDISEEPTRRLAVEARGRHERIMSLDPSRPRPGIELRPIRPSLLRGERRQPPPAWARIER